MMTRGPVQMINASEFELLQSAVERLAEGARELPDFAPDFDGAKAREVLDEVAVRMQDNYPYHHPLYAGQMLKPPHPVARIAYALSLWVNPNNHALDGGRASSAMEKECIIELGRVFGWDAPLGHLTGGGTMANLEALWIGGRLNPGKTVLASSQAHYTHGRISEVLGLPFRPVDVDDRGRMDPDALARELAKGDVGTVVATIGNTGIGAVDSLPEILGLAKQYGVRVHADAAYGGYFGLAGTLDQGIAASYSRLADVDSIVVDPHKHGLQPYGCGCVLFKDPTVGAFYKHGSPYTYFSSTDLHLGEISLECSRAGAAAVALWATHRLLPPVPGGEFAAGLDSCLAAARDFHSRLTDGENYTPLFEPELDIVVYAPRAGAATEVSRLARQVFEIAAGKDLHLALMALPLSLVAGRMPGLDEDAETVTCLRSVLMKPEHADWTERIVAILDEAATLSR